MSVPLLFLVVYVALVSAGEEPLPQHEMDPHRHVTTVCIQVHGSSALCGPMVKPEAARAAQQLEAARGSLQMTQGAEPAQFQAAQFRDAGAAGPPNDAVLQGFYENVPVYKMRSADELHKSPAGHSGQPPCPETASRSVGGGSVVSVVQPPNYGLHSPLMGGGLGYGGLGGLGNSGSVVTVQQPPQLGYFRSAEPGPPAARTIPFAPFGVEQQQQHQQAQHMRASQLAAARSQQYAAMRAAPNDDCDDNGGSARQFQQFQPQVRGSFSGLQQQMRQAYPQPAYTSVRGSADSLAKQCAEQEVEIKKKSEEIVELKKQLDRLSSMTEKTTIEQKTVSVKSASSSDSLKDVDDKPKDNKNKKK